MNANRVKGLLIACAAAAALTAVAEPRPPNVVFILADDMSYDSVSHLNPEIGAMKTPAIDSLAREGLVFTDAHSGSAVCTPTRYGLLTGRYCWRTQLKKGVGRSYGQPLISDERLTVAELLQAQGYRTACVGKWHLGMEWPGKDGRLANEHIGPIDNPTKKKGKKSLAYCESQLDFTQPIKGPRSQGFDYYFGVDVPNFPPYTWIENDHVTVPATEPKPDDMYGVPGLMAPGWKLEAILPTLAEKAADWITQTAPKKEPYFLYLALTSPHTPIAPSARFKGKSGISEYADFVMETDWAVGQVLEAIQQSGDAANTLVIFSADNGTSSLADLGELKSKGVDLNHHFRGHKKQIYEGGHRVPLLMRWPESITPGRTCSETVCLNDFMATMAELTQFKLPANAAEDSCSMLPLITGKVTELPHHPAVVNHGSKGEFAIRQDGWKLILPLSEKGQPELYNLLQDPKESTNVADQHPERVTEMNDRLQSYVNNGRSMPEKR